MQTVFRPLLVFLKKKTSKHDFLHYIFAFFLEPFSHLTMKKYWKIILTFKKVMKQCINMILRLVLDWSAIVYLFTLSAMLPRNAIKKIADNFPARHSTDFYYRILPASGQT